MKKGKKIVCLCEDVTQEDVEAAIDMGYRDVESLKRYTGIATGPCQGKICLAHVVRILARKTGKSPDEVGLPTLRQPFVPVLLAALVEREELEG
jgi:NAD(P)H-nitrite reductase large subunit